MITNDMVSMKPFVVMAIKVLGPGRRRLELVKLAHDMSDARGPIWLSEGRFQVADEPQVLPPSRRAA
jgi:hypothetical protein